MRGMILEVQCLSPHNFFNMNLHENLVIMELAYRSITTSLYISPQRSELPTIRFGNILQKGYFL